MSGHRTFVCADPHFGHKGIVKFTNPDGSKLRPWNTIEEHDSTLISLWNQTVGVNDKVYILGDFCINRKALATAEKLHGDLVLIKGNHDIFNLSDYTPYFRDIRAYHILPAHGAILSHIPVHPNQLERWRLNIHGHLHAKVVMKEQVYETYRIDKNDFMYKETKIEPDERYKCVSMEHIDFKPVLLDTLL